MKFLRFFTLLALASSLFVACDEEYTTYSDAEYVIFADTMSINMVTPDEEYFTVALSSTVARDYDRTFGVEVVDEGSNAVEGKHFQLLSNSVTIPAGKLATEVKIKGLYDNIEPTDSLGFTLRLINPEALDWELYKENKQTKVVMYKACPFDVNNFSGWCVVTSLLLRSYPGDNAGYQRLIQTSVHPSVPNTVILHDCFYNGYDLTITFDPSNAANPLVTMDKDQLLSDEASVFGQILGDNHILTTHSSYYPSYFNSCQRFVELWNEVYVEDLGEMIGTVGHFYSILEWVSDEVAADLKKQGM